MVYTRPICVNVLPLHDMNPIFFATITRHCTVQCGNIENLKAHGLHHKPKSLSFVALYRYFDTPEDPGEQKLIPISHSAQG